MTKFLTAAGAALLAAGMSFAAHAQSFTPGPMGTIASPGSVSYGDSFSTGLETFTDVYTFSFTPTSSFDSFAATINLGSSIGINGISGQPNIEVAVFNTTGSTLTAGTHVGSTGDTGAILGLGWTSGVVSTTTVAPGVTDTLVTIYDASLTGGNYTLEVRGTTSSVGGSYSGVINLSAVPEASSVLLLCLGLPAVFFGAWRARRRQ